ncbi:MAG: glycoside hydrolase family 88 protein [Bacteroidales bacterium]
MPSLFWILLTVFCMINLSGHCQDTSGFQGKAFEKEYILQLLHRVNDYQQDHPGWTDDRNWERATYYTGVMAFFNAVKNKEILNQAVKWADSHDWKVGNELMFPANRFTCVQTYLEVFFQTGNATQISKSKEYMDSEILKTEPAYLRGWYYIDALYVGPPAFVMMSKATGNKKYNDYINPTFWDIADQLYDEDAGLFYRDSKARYEEKAKTAKKVLGQGVMVGLWLLFQGY